MNNDPHGDYINERVESLTKAGKDREFIKLNDLIPPMVKMVVLRPSDKLVISNWGEDVSMDDVAEVKELCKKAFGLDVVCIGPDVTLSIVREDDE